MKKPSAKKQGPTTPKQPIDVAWPPLGVSDLPADVPARPTPDPAGFSTLKHALLRSLRARTKQ